MYVTVSRADDGEYTYSHQIVDDKNIPAETLGRRRLLLDQQGVRLKKLTKALFFLGDVVKLGKKGVWFIDNSGYVFTYVKTRRIPLRFFKVEKFIPIKTGGTLLEIKGIPGRFKTLHNPLSNEKYAGILVDGMKYILYGLFTEQHQNTVRAV